MLGLSTMPSSNDFVLMQRVEYRVEHRLAHLMATLDAVIAVDQHFRLDDGHDPFLLADRGVARQHFGIRPDAERVGLRSVMAYTSRHFAKRAPWAL